jgi:hypothetical protein
VVASLPPKGKRGNPPKGWFPSEATKARKTGQPPYLLASLAVTSIAITASQVRGQATGGYFVTKQK